MRGLRDKNCVAGGVGFLAATAPALDCILLFLPPLPEDDFRRRLPPVPCASTFICIPMGRIQALTPVIPRERQVPMKVFALHISTREQIDNEFRDFRRVQ